jgi:hypothetical protein
VQEFVSPGVGDLTAANPAEGANRHGLCGAIDLQAWRGCSRSAGFDRSARRSRSGAQPRGLQEIAPRRIVWRSGGTVRRVVIRAAGSPNAVLLRPTSLFDGDSPSSADVADSKGSLASHLENARQRFELHRSHWGVRAPPKKGGLRGFNGRPPIAFDPKTRLVSEVR